MTEIWKDETFKGELSELEFKYFTLAQGITTKSDLDMQRKQVTDRIEHIEKLNKKIIRMCIPTVLITVLLLLYLYSGKNFLTHGKHILGGALIFSSIGLLYLISSLTTKANEKEDMFFTLEPISKDGLSVLEAHQLCDDSPAANAWRKAAVKARGDILVGDLLIMIKLKRVEEKLTKNAEGLGAYQTLLARN